MDCTSCGVTAEAESTHCSNCGEALQTVEETEPSSASRKTREPGIASGCLILIRSLFTMPIKTASLAAHELRKIAKAGAIDTDRDFPHLFWCKAMLPVIATFLSGVVFLGTLGIIIAERGIVGLFVGLVAAPLAAILTDWLIMIVGEYLVIKVVSVRYYTQQIKAHENKNGQD